jgi:hypothetical protein
MQKLAYKWSKRHKDYLIHFPTRPDGRLLYGFFESDSAKEFLKELEARGYDLTTLKFEVKLK